MRNGCAPRKPGTRRRQFRFGRDRDSIESDAEGRLQHLDVAEQALAHRRGKWQAPEQPSNGGYQQLYVEYAVQANQGPDLDFLRGCRTLTKSGANPTDFLSD
jgi:hypothetical protein